MKKKMIALTMSVLMAASLSACGGGKSDASSDAATTAAETTKAAEAEAKDESTEAEEETKAQDAAAAEGKVYKIATDTTFAPFEFENDKGEMVGIDLDLLKAIA